jgi:hypothetical protein
VVTVETTVGPDVTSLTFARGRPDVESTTDPETLWAVATALVAAGDVSAAASAGAAPSTIDEMMIAAKLLDMTRPPFKLRMISV